MSSLSEESIGGAGPSSKRGARRERAAEAEEAEEARARARRRERPRWRREEEEEEEEQVIFLCSSFSSLAFFVFGPEEERGKLSRVVVSGSGKCCYLN